MTNYVSHVTTLRMGQDNNRLRTENGKFVGKNFQLNCSCDGNSTHVADNEHRVQDASVQVSQLLNLWCWRGDAVC